MLFGRIKLLNVAIILYNKTMVWTIYLPTGGTIMVGRRGRSAVVGQRLITKHLLARVLSSVAKVA